MSEPARHLDAAFLFQPEREREGMMNRLEFSSYVSSAREREIQGIFFWFFLYFIYLVFCVKRSRSLAVAAAHLPIFVVLLSSSSGWPAALFSTSIITVPFICLPLRCQVHPDLSSLRQRPAAAHLTRPDRNAMQDFFFLHNACVCLPGHLFVCALCARAGLSACRWAHTKSCRARARVNRERSIASSTFYCCNCTTEAVWLHVWVHETFERASSRHVWCRRETNNAGGKKTWETWWMRSRASILGTLIIALPSSRDHLGISFSLSLNPALYLTTYLNSDALRCWFISFLGYNILPTGSICLLRQRPRRKFVE